MLGLKWSKDYSDNKEMFATAKSLAESLPEGPAKDEVMAPIKKAESAITASRMLLVAAGLGIAGAVLLLRKMTVPAAGALAVGGILPVIFSTSTLLTTTFLLIAAVLAFISSRKPATGAAPMAAPVAI